VKVRNFQFIFSSDHSEQNDESDHDDFLDKRKRDIRHMNLYLQMPDEVYVEIVKDFPACFYDISK